MVSEGSRLEKTREQVMGHPGRGRVSSSLLCLQASIVNNNKWWKNGSSIIRCL